MAIIVLLKEFKKVKITEEVPFDYYLKEVFHKVYNEDGAVIITQIITVTVLYFILFYFFINILSNNVPEFKRIIKFNSKSTISYYRKSLIYFGKIFVSTTILYLITFIGSYAIIVRNNNINSYLIGAVDLIKLPTLMFLVLCLSIIFSISRALIFSLLYADILFYIFYLNGVNYIYLLLLSLIILLVCVVSAYIKKEV